MDVRTVMMGDPETRPRAGAHNSDGWDVDSPWHKHDMHQLLYAFEGAVEVEGNAGRYKVPRQFAVWIPAGTVHRTRIQRVPSGSVFLAPDLVQAEPGCPRVVPVPGLMREMIIHAMRWPIDAPLDSTGVAFFDCFARLCAEWTTSEIKLVLPGSDDRKIAAIMAYTEDHIAGVTLRAVCAAVGMSERSLRRHFGAKVGLSWEEYRRRLRICRAIEDLDYSDKPIGAIAADVGYESPAAFAAAFKTMMGTTPDRYRRLRGA